MTGFRPFFMRGPARGSLPYAECGSCASSDGGNIHLLDCTWTPKGKRGLELTGALHGSREENIFQPEKISQRKDYDAVTDTGIIQVQLCSGNVL